MEVMWVLMVVGKLIITGYPTETACKEAAKPLEREWLTYCISAPSNAVIQLPGKW